MDFKQCVCEKYFDITYRAIKRRERRRGKEIVLSKHPPAPYGFLHAHQMHSFIHWTDRPAKPRWNNRILNSNLSLLNEYMKAKDQRYRCKNKMCRF